MAKQEVGLKIDVDVKSVGNVKKELRAAQTELIAMRDRFGETSQEAINAARKVAELRDRIEGAKEAADLFDPGKRFQAFTTAASQLAAGFSAVQGAMALAGNESEDLQKTLARVQGAMALSQGLSELKDLGKSYEQLKIVAISLGNTIKTQVVAAFTTLRGAMMATGIGLITSAVAFLIANFDSVKKTLGDLFPVLKNTGDLMDRLKQIAMGVGNAILQFLAAPVSALIKIFQGDFKGAIDSVKNGFAFVKNFREGEKKEIESQAADAEAARQAELEKQKEANKKKLEEQKKAAEERLKKLKEQQEKERQLREAADKVLDDARRSKLTEQQRAEEDIIRKFEEGKKTLQAAGIKDFTAIEEQKELELAAIRKKYKDEEDTRLKKIEEERIKKEQDNLVKKTDSLLKEAENDQLTFEQRLAKIQEREALENQIIFSSQEEKTAFEKANADARIKIAEEEAKAKEDQLMRGVAMLSQVADLVGRETAAGKAAAIAGATIDTYQAAWRAFKNAQANPISILGPAYPYIAAGLAVAGGIANIRKIAAVQTPKGGGGGGGIPSGGGGITTTAPVTPALAPQVVATQVNTAAVNQMGNRAARAYVLNSDIQNDNQRNAYIDRSASIG